MSGLCTKENAPLLGFVGIQLCASWINDYLQPYGGMVYLPSICVEGAAAFALCLAARFGLTERRLFGRTLRWVPLLLGIVALAVGVATLASRSAAPRVAVAVVGGVAVALGYARWMYLYGLAETRLAVGGLTMAFVVTGCFKFATPYVPLAVQACIVALLLGISAWCDCRLCRLYRCRPAYAAGREAGLPSESGSRAGFPLTAYLPLLAELAVFSVTLGYMSGFMPVWEPSLLRFVLRLACAVVLFVALYVWNKPIDLLHFIQVSLLLVLAGPVSVAFFSAYTDVLITTGICLIQIMVLVSVVNSMAFDGRSPYALFGGVWGIFALGLGLGRVACSVFSAVEPTVQAALVAVCAVTVVSVFALTRYQDMRQYGRGQEAAGESNAAAGDESSAPQVPPRLDDAAWERRWGQLGAFCSLTPRECEVARLIASGYSKKHVAEVLSISENTVRMHARGIYSKLGIHTKQELICLVEGG